MRRTVVEPRPGQDGRQGHPRELPGAGDHALLCPDRPWPLALKILEEVGIAPRALHDRAHRTGRHAPHVFVGERHWILHLAVDGQPPVFRPDRLRYGKVLHHVEQVRRRHVAFQVHDRRADARDTLLVVDDHPGLGSVAAGPAVPGATVSAVWLRRRRHGGCLREDCIGCDARFLGLDGHGYTLLSRMLRMTVTAALGWGTQPVTTAEHVNG